MCDPVSIGSAAVGAAGAAVSGYERSQSQADMINARNAATMAELERQRVYGDRARAEFGKSLAVYDPNAQREGLATAQTGYGNTLNANAPTDVGSITTTTAPAVVGQSENRKVSDVFAKAGDRSQRLAKLKGYDQQRFGDALKVGQVGRDIDMIGDFSRTSSGVSGVEQRAAYNNAARAPSGIGDLLSFGGQIGGYYGGRGGGGQRGPIFSPNTSAGAIYG